MSHFVIKLKKNQDPSLFIQRAAEVIKEGGVIAYPTDTVYGMGADPLNIHAVEKIYQLKNRDKDQGLPILVSDLEEAKKVGVFSKYDIKIAEKYWPGALTLIVPLKTADTLDNLTSMVALDRAITGGKDTVALRVPSNEIILGICKELKNISSFGGVIGTSANYSGEPNNITGKQVSDDFSMVLNFIIDTGRCKGKIPSTIIEIENKLIEIGDPIENCIKVLREGKIEKEEIITTLKN